MMLVLEADFLEAAVRAVVAIVDGHIQALNPGDDPAFHVFVFNDMFFTRTFDYRERVKQARKRRASKAVGACCVLWSGAVPRMNMVYMYTQHTHGHASYQLRAAPIPSASPCSCWQVCVKKRMHSYTHLSLRCTFCTDCKEAFPTHAVCAVCCLVCTLSMKPQKPPRGLDIRDDCAMEAPVAHDIQAIQAVNAAGVKGLHTVMYALIEHLGQRFTAQSVIPGILQVLPILLRRSFRALACVKFHRVPALCTVRAPRGRRARACSSRAFVLSLSPSPMIDFVVHTRNHPIPTPDHHPLPRARHPPQSCMAPPTTAPPSRMTKSASHPASCCRRTSP